MSEIKTFESQTFVFSVFKHPTGLKSKTKVSIFQTLHTSAEIQTKSLDFRHILAKQKKWTTTWFSKTMFLGGWVDVKAVLGIAYSNKKHAPRWMGGWMDGCKSSFKDSLQQSTNIPSINLLSKWSIVLFLLNGYFFSWVCAIWLILFMYCKFACLTAIYKE